MCCNKFLNVKVVTAAFNQDEALVGPSPCQTLRRFVSGSSHHRHLGYDLQEVVAEVELHQVGDALEAAADHDMNAAVAEALYCTVL